MFNNALDPISKKMLGGAGRHGPLILMYHSITPGGTRPEWPWALSYDAFCAQLDLLKAWGWQTITQSDLQPDSDTPEKTVVLTFDDGYVDNYPAFEALRERGLCATWFMVSNDVGKINSWKDPGVAAQQLLTGAQLRELIAGGMEVGSHTCSHRRLTRLSETECRGEITHSKSALEDITGQKINAFAYPYGDFDAHCAEIVAQSGYKNACTTRSGWALKSADMFTLRRISVFNTDTIASFARKLAFAANDVGCSALTRYYAGRLISRFPGSNN